MTWSRLDDRPMLYCAYLSWDGKERVVLVSELPIVKETKTRWYLERAAPPGSPWQGARIVPKSEYFYFRCCSMDRSAAVRNLVTRTRQCCDDDLARINSTLAAVAEAERRLTS